ncbi:Conserved_hypothetical protein [Hexamita inflata]|uniref:FERM central domain-containing protein n=1 Tax=Hexamita inflata TaxID=28002 RepID=A0AA86P483_9EUKA|nr:Conserved hypothetical protein [Hexamita inflata]
MHLKIYLIGSFMGVKVTEATTVRELVETILARYQVPIEYAKMCTIVAKKGTEYGITLQHSELIQNYQNCILYFRIIQFFGKELIEQLNPMYIQMAQLQMHKLVTSSLWLTDQNTACSLAAYQCAIEFGSYNGQQFGFVNNTISTLLSAEFIDKKKQIQQDVINKWKEYSEQGLVETKQKAILNYLHTAAEWVPQFGTYVINCYLLNQDYQVIGTECFLSVAKDKCIVTSLTNQVLAYSDWSDTDLQISPRDSKRFTLKINNKNFEFQCENIVKFQPIIEWQKTQSYNDLISIDSTQQNDEQLISPTTCIESEQICTEQIEEV